MKTTVFFDLDGTLTDSRMGILTGMATALTALGMKTSPEELDDRIIGPPLYDSFRSLYGLSEAASRRGVELYREYYAREGLFVNKVYDGVPEMLSRLASAGLRLAIATGKPHVYARRIAKHLGLPFADGDVFGIEFDGTRGDKGELLAYAMEQLALSPDECLMVGDRLYDIQGAHTAGITPLGVLWGYGSREELIGAGAAHLAATPGEAAEHLLRLSKE